MRTEPLREKPKLAAAVARAVQRKRETGMSMREAMLEQATRANCSPCQAMWRLLLTRKP